MAHIQPNGVVYLIRGYQGDKDYNHTYRFNSAIEQYGFFYNLVPEPKTKFSFTNQNYIRHTVGVLRLKGISDDYITCNYMMFKNTAFANKWFYAFIDKVEYVNNNCCEVYYTIDVIQTWWFDFEVGECFVEREHTQTDNYGAYLIPEPFSTGMKVGYKVITRSFTDFEYLILYNKNDSGGSYINGLYTPQSILIINQENIGTLSREVNRLITEGATITSISVIPSECITTDSTKPFPTKVASIIISPPWDVDNGELHNGYKPKNNKIYTAQFCDLHVTNASGGKADYLWEIFKGNATFEFHSIIMGDACLICKPFFYSNLGFANEDFDVGFVGYPQVTWSEDTYARFMASNAASFNTKATLGVFQGALSIAQGAVSGGVLGAIGGVANLANNIASPIAQVRDLKNSPDNIMGNNSGNTLQVARGTMTFYFVYRSCRGEELKSYDDYFTMFGYLVNSVKQPNIKNENSTLRPNWNYIKTRGCILHPISGGGLPSEDEKLIANIFDNGITFWSVNDGIGVPVGSYDLDNSPI